MATKSDDDADKLLENLTLDPTAAVSTSELKEIRVKEDSTVAIVRHCAACLQVCQPPVKTCRGCKKRAYCSKKCQSDDWSLTGTGQRHKNWCGRYEYGEEDIDWEVVPVPNKGLGIVAKKFIPCDYRIIVEPVYTSPTDHPAIKDLEPKGGSLQKKFDLNSFDGVEMRDSGKDMLGLRLSRVNHSCRPNAGIHYDGAARVKLLVAQRDIQPGDEICICYSSFGRFDSKYVTIRNFERGMELEMDRLMGPRFNLVRTTQSNLLTPDLSSKVEDFNFDAIRRELYRSWGIICPADCYCRDPHAKKLAAEGKELYQQMIRFASMGRLKEALKAGDKMLENDKELNCLWTQRFAFYFFLFEIAEATPETEAKARQYLQSCVQLGRILAPYSEETRTYEGILEHPETNFYYYPDENKISAVMSKFKFLLALHANQK